MTDKRKRAAPTIDLTATEVAGAPEPQAEPQAERQAEPPPEPPRTDEPQGAASAPPPPHAPLIKTYATPIAAGLAGAILAGAAIWVTGLWPGWSHDGAQIAALQKQIQDLQKRAAPAADTQALDALRQRVDKIAQDMAGLPPGDKSIADRLAAADSAMKSLGVALAALNMRSDDAAADAKQASERAAAAEKAVSELRASVQSARQQAASAVDAGQLAAVQQRVGALEQAVKSVREQIAQTSATDTAARLALSAAALRDAVARGEPYADALAQTKALGGDDAALAPLVPFAATGLPSQQALARELNQLMPALMTAAGAQNAPSGFLERLQANASRLVRVSPVNAPAGDNPSDLLARLEVEAAHLDLAAALADLAKLPPPARAPAQAWIDKAKARQAALAAARKLAADSARALGR